MTDQDRREALANDAAWQSGFARGRADERRAAAEPDLHDHRLFGASPEPTPGLRDRMEPRDLPARVVVGKNGAYWRDYGDGYSMCPVSEDNDPVEPVAIYVRDYLDPVLDAALAASPAPEPRTCPSCGAFDGHAMGCLVSPINEPAPEPTGLDVERLAEWFCMTYDHDDHDAFLQPDHCDQGLLEAKDAAEYARLTDSGATDGE